MMGPINRGLLKEFNLLSGLSEPAYEALRSILEGQELPAGTVLFTQEEPGEALFLVTEGTLSVQVKTANGAVENLPEVHRGQVLGELAFIDPAPRSTTVTAKTMVRVYKMDRAGYRALQKKAPEAASALVGAILRDVTRRLRVIDERIEALLTPKPAVEILRVGQALDTSSQGVT